MKLLSPTQLRLIVLTVVSLTCSGATKESVVVRAVRHREDQATTTSAGTNRTTCSPNGNDLYCVGTSTPPTTQVTAIRITEVVEGNGQIYTISCTKWAFGGYSCGTLIDGQDFHAEIEGKAMWILGSKNGNQGKQIRVKFDILDIRPSSPPKVESPVPAAVDPAESTTGNTKPSEPPTAHYGPPLEPPRETALKNEDILRLKSLGFSDELLITSIRAANKTDFHVAVDDLAALRDRGISEAVLIEMLGAAKREEK